MNLALLFISFVMLASAAIAMSLRNLIHSALLLVASWAGIAAFYLWAGAEFLAFAQVLIYVGAVSMVVLFAVLLTRQSRVDATVARAPFGRTLGALLAGSAVAGVLVGAILGTPLPASAEPPPVLTVRLIGRQLMGPHAAALLVVGIILTVALLGGIDLAATASDRKPADSP
jgi:NADH:ubiquinone oxidoreductase subunit 6 (subunit J)